MRAELSASIKFLVGWLGLVHQVKEHVVLFGVLLGLFFYYSQIGCTRVIKGPFKPVGYISYCSIFVITFCELSKYATTVKFVEKVHFPKQ